MFVPFLKFLFRSFLWSIASILWGMAGFIEIPFEKNMEWEENTDAGYIFGNR